ncbi:MAG: hypothetical protein ABI673_05670 [Novosphingobium sp.]
MIGAENHLANAVILNLFQDPFLSLTGPRKTNACRAVGFKPAQAGQAAQWVLKQVQDDEKCNTGLLS